MKAVIKLRIGFVESDDSDKVYLIKGKHAQKLIFDPNI